MKRRRRRALLAAVAVTAGVVAVGAPAAADHPRGAIAPFDLACGSGVPEDGFADIAEDNAHEPAVDCAFAHGLTSGTSPTTYSPAVLVTRAQMATFVVRLLSMNATHLQGSSSDAFDDDAGSPHEEAINRLASAGLVSGTAQRVYSPDLPVTRGQMATFLVRAYERRYGMALPQARNRFADDDASAHARSIDQVAALGVTSGASADSFAADRPLRRDQMARFLASSQGCMRVWLRDGHYYYPQCDSYTDTDGEQALQGFDVLVSTDAEHYTAGQGVGVSVQACNRRSTELVQVFPQKDWFALEARHEALERNGHEGDLQWYDHRWTRTLNGSGYAPRDRDPLDQRLSSGRPRLAALTWYDGPQSNPEEQVSWQPGECKTVDVGHWQQHDTDYYFDGDATDFPARWGYPARGVYRTVPGWYSLRAHWGGVEVGQARRYLTSDSSRFNLDGPRVGSAVEQRRYEPGELVPVTVTACNDSDEPYSEFIGQRDSSGDATVLWASVSGNFDDSSSSLGTITVSGRLLEWAPGECKAWQFAWDQRVGDRDPAPSEVFRVSVGWNPASDERLQDPVAGASFALR